MVRRKDGMKVAMQGCHKAARLLSEQRERPLGLFERAGLRVHLWACTGCMNYARQLDLLDRASERWRSADPSAGEAPPGH
jgi:hypothetical protein